MAAPTRRTEKRHTRTEQILDAALSVFSRKGYHAGALDDIADESEVSKGGVYRYFPSKQALFLALLDRMAGLLRGRVEAAIAHEADPIAKADIALQVVLQTFVSHRTLSRLFFVESLGAGPEFNERMASIRNSFSSMIQVQLDEAVRQNAISPLDTAVAARVWFGALNQVVTDWVLGDPAVRLEDSYPTLRALLLRGIGAQVPIPTALGPATNSLLNSSPIAPPDSTATDTALAELQVRFRQRVEAASDTARRSGQPVLASASQRIADVNPLGFFARGEQVASQRAFWARPRTGFALAAVGEAHEILGLPATAATAWQQLLANAQTDESSDTIGVGPLLLGGFAFDVTKPSTDAWHGFPDGRFVLPRYLLTASDGATWLTLSAVLKPDSEPGAVLSAGASDLPRLLGSSIPTPLPAGTSAVSEPISPREWQSIVQSVRDDIRSGEADKVVIAREVHLQVETNLDTTSALGRLRADYPSCFVYAIAKGDRTFLGATPERLVRLRDGIVTTMCLAGSIRRGETESADRELGDQLLADAKERSEHDFVVRGLRSALAEVCDEVAPVSTPVLLKVRNVQHLLTTVAGRINEGSSILEVVEHLHPTPAVGGFPREQALEIIRRKERLDRGWYAGPIGWVDAAGEGELAVALRCGLVRGNEATLFAGCGIVADSDPESEYAESRLKLRPMLSALGGE